MPKKSSCFCSLRALLKERDMTIEDLADAIGTTKGRLGPKMQGKASWTTEAMFAVCDCLEIPPEKVRYYFQEPPGGWLGQRKDNRKREVT